MQQIDEYLATKARHVSIINITSIFIIIDYYSLYYGYDPNALALADMEVVIPGRGGGHLTL